MNIVDLIQIIFYCIALLILIKPLGLYIAQVFKKEKTFLDFILLPIEKFIYKFSGINSDSEQGWVEYTTSLLTFNFLGIFVLYLVLRLQNFLPDLAFNTAISFTSNTNWQSYLPEGNIKYFTELVGFTVQNFLSGATGITVAIAFIKSFTRENSNTIGNFWFDLTRSVLWILLPLSLILSLCFVWQGIPQNFKSPIKISTLEGKTQIIPQGPVASRESIKIIGTNGGGFFNANSSHPYENPTPLSNFLQMLFIFSIGASLVYTFGYMVGDTRQGWIIFSAMSILFLVGFFLVYFSELNGNPLFSSMVSSNLDSIKNMEGKEVRFGILNSVLFSSITTCASCGAINSMHDSFTPLGGMILLINILLGEIIIGGVGAGLYGILHFAILTVFISGLMVGRTPEYLGKKIESREVKMTVLGVLVLPLTVHIFTALSCIIPVGKEGIYNLGPHGFSEILYAFSSSTANNGSAFSGLNSNTFYYNLTTAISMILGRFFTIIPTMAIIGSLSMKKIIPPSVGTFPTNGFTFLILLIVVILTVGGLVYFPALSLGPIVEHLHMISGKVY